MARRVLGKSSPGSITSTTVYNSTFTTNCDKANALATHFASISFDSNYDPIFLKHKNSHTFTGFQHQPVNETHFLNDPIALFELIDAIFAW